MKYTKTTDCSSAFVSDNFKIMKKSVSYLLEDVAEGLGRLAGFGETGFEEEEGRLMCS
jgi:hypothetical protein